MYRFQKIPVVKKEVNCHGIYCWVSFDFALVVHYMCVLYLARLIKIKKPPGGIMCLTVTAKL